VAAGRPKRPDGEAGARTGRERDLAGIRGFARGAPLAELPATARRILEAARRILERDGYTGLTYEAIAAESGEYKDSVRYHFGGKAGLVAAIVDSSVHDASLAIFAEAREIDHPLERVTAVVGASRELPGADDAWLMWELLPHITRREDLRARVADLYEWYREHYLEVFRAGSGDERASGSGDARTGGSADARGAGWIPPELARDYASILLAVLDGLAMQKALDPDGVDLDAVFGLWQRIVTASMRALAIDSAEAAEASG
jgi:AcrR family transcriptional regulator